MCTLCHCPLCQEYDYVFDIELDEGSPTMRKLKLPYNRSGRGEIYIYHQVP